MKLFAGHHTQRLIRKSLCYLLTCNIFQDEWFILTTKIHLSLKKYKQIKNSFNIIESNIHLKKIFFSRLKILILLNGIIFFSNSIAFKQSVHETTNGYMSYGSISCLKRLSLDILASIF